MLFRRWPTRLIPRYRRLMRDGVRAEAVVIRSEGWGAYNGGGSHTKVKLRLKVYYGDGAVAEIDRAEEVGILGPQIFVGSTLPVRHEVADRAYVEIDRIEARRRFDAYRAEQAEHDQARIRDAEARLARTRKPTQEPRRDQP